MYIFTLIAAVAAIALLCMILKNNLTKGSSCCGEHEAPVERIRAADPVLAHYPYHYRLAVGGMVCANCAKRVENAFHLTGEMLAEADLGKKEVKLSSKQPLDRRKTAGIVDAAGYTLLEYEETTDVQ